MIHPSYSELMNAINANQEEDDAVINSRYSLVIATSKRARQIISGSQPRVAGAKGKKPLSTAVQEVYEGQIRILAQDEEEAETEFMMEAPEETAEMQMEAETEAGVEVDAEAEMEAEAETETVME